MRYLTGFLLSLAVVAATADVSAKSLGDDKKAGYSRDLHCLAQNIYHEARGEPMVGKVAVAHVVLNRVADRRWPRQICSVIKQGGYKRLHRCQFSWWCDGRSDTPRDRAAWKESLHVAKMIKKGVINDPTNGALWYHALSVSPSWAKKLDRYTRIGQHVFYTDPKRAPQQVADATE
ncbi:unnamed protein product [Laminaria digitata]